VRTSKVRIDPPDYMQCQKMNRSYLVRLRILPHRIIFDLRWKLGLFKKTKSTGGETVTYLPDGELYFIPSQDKARNAHTKPLE
jgi:hypothetical protein